MKLATNSLNQTKLSYMKISDYKDESPNSKAEDEKPINVLIYYDQSLMLSPNGTFQIPLNNQPNDCIRWSLSPKQIWTLNLTNRTRIHYVRIKLYGKNIEDLYLNHEISIELSLKNFTLNTESLSSVENTDSFSYEFKCRETTPKENQFSTYFQKYSANYLVLDFLCEMEDREKSILEIFTDNNDYEVDEIFANSIEIGFEMLNLLEPHKDNVDSEFKQKIFVISLCELQLYSFKSDCGLPDVPVSAIVQRDLKYIKEQGDIHKSYKYICLNKNQDTKGIKFTFSLVLKFENNSYIDNPIIECGHYGKWKTEFPKCVRGYPCDMLKSFKLMNGYVMDVKYETTTLNEFKIPIVPDGKFAKIFCIRIIDNQIVTNQQLKIGNETINNGSIELYSQVGRDLTQVTCQNGKWIGLENVNCIIQNISTNNNNEFKKSFDKNFPYDQIEVLSLPVRVIKILFGMFLFLLLVIICLLIYMIIVRKQIANRVQKEGTIQSMQQYSNNEYNNEIQGMPTINFDTNNYHSAEDFYERITLNESHVYSSIENQNHYHDLSLYPTYDSRKCSINSCLNSTNFGTGEERNNSIYGMDLEDLPTDSQRKYSLSTIDRNYPGNKLTPPKDNDSGQYNSLSRASSGYLKANPIYES